MRVDPLIVAIPLACLIVLVGLILVGVRAVRTARERRRARLGEAPRRALLAFVAEGGEEGMDDLLAIPPAAWRAAEPTAVTLLGKVRGDAHRGLAEVFERRGVTERAMADLTHRDPVRRARAAELLGDLRLTEAVKPLCMLLNDHRADVRVVAVRALGAIGDPAAAEPLLDALTRNVPSQMVADALARIGVDSVPALHGALGHREALVVVTALEGLALLGATGSAEAVAAVLRDSPEPAVRVAAAAALGRLGGRAALAPLLAAADPGNPSTLRTAAAQALGALGAVSTGTALAALLADPAYRVAHEAARALVRLGPAGLTHLREAAEGPAGDRAAEHAREALALAALAGG
jgi:HEAT repeat protein